MIGFLVKIAIVIGIIYLVREMFSSGPKNSGAKAKPKPAQKPPRDPNAELLVEDPQCGVFVPLSHSVKGPGDTRFCSEECLNAYKKANG